MVIAVARALDLLEAASLGRMGLVDLGRATGLSPSTAHRLLATLSAHGLLDRDEEGRYSVSAAAALFAGGSSVRERELVAAVRPLMQRVHRVTHLGVNLSTLQGDEVVFAYRMEDTRWLITLIHEDLVVPFHVSAAGKCLMAYRTRGVGSRKLKAFTNSSIVTLAEVKHELNLARVKGYSVSWQEFQLGINCVAAPIMDRNGMPIAAISVSGPAKHITREVSEDIGELLMFTAREASETLSRLEGPNHTAPLLRVAGHSDSEERDLT